MLLLIVMAFAFLTSACFFAPLFRAHMARRTENCLPLIPPRLLWILHLLGVCGSALFVHDLQVSGQLKDTFFHLLIQNPLEIRKADLTGVVRGIYLSYIGWLAAFVSGVFLARRVGRKSTHLVLIGLQLAANLVFLNKTRLVAVLLVAGLGYLFTTDRSFSMRGVVGATSLLAVVFITLFIGWSSATGKVFKQGVGLPPAVETFALYLTAGPPYLAHVVNTEPGGVGLPVRTLRPLFKASSKFFGTPTTPSPINDFYYLPYSTNVGTALEPFYRDAGGVGLILGIFILSFGVDFLALFALRFGCLAGHLTVAALCYSSLSAFFVPKLTTGPVLLTFVFLALSFYGRMIIYSGKLFAK